MAKGSIIGLDSDLYPRALAGLPFSYTRWVGGRILGFLGSLRGILAFGLIALGVLLVKRRQASNVIYPVIWQQLVRSGVAMLPVLLFLAAVLGMVVIGQTLLLTSKLGAQQWIGTIMGSVVVRELGPLLAAVVVLTRAGTANVIELGTARASGEVEALEVLGIDPVHYLVIPRLVGISISVFCLTVYVIVTALGSGYLWAFVRDVPILPLDYFNQLASALHPLDFLVLGVKSFGLGIIIALVTCYHGLAHPLAVEEISRATIRAITQGVVLCVMADAFFLLVFMVL